MGSLMNTVNRVRADLEIGTVLRERVLPGKVWPSRHSPGGTTYASHAYTLIEARRESERVNFPAEVYIKVNHGGGVELFHFKGFLPQHQREQLFALDEDFLYGVLYDLYYSATCNHEEGATLAARRYKKAFVDGRLRKRKLPSQGCVKVWIEGEGRAPDFIDSAPDASAV